MKRHLFTSSAGIDHYMIEDEAGLRFASSQSTEQILDQNKRMATWNDGYSPTRELRRVASIPYILMLKWRNEEGWWAMDAGHDPDVARKLAAKLNSNEYEYLRTAEGRVGVSNGVLR
jgi:hypothetical protein